MGDRERIYKLFHVHSVSMDNISFIIAHVLGGSFIPKDIKEYFLNKLEINKKFTYEKLKEIIEKS